MGHRVGFQTNGHRIQCNHHTQTSLQQPKDLPEYWFHDVSYVSWASCQHMANTQGYDSDMIQFAVDAVDAADGASLIAQHYGIPQPEGRVAT